MSDDDDITPPLNPETMKRIRDNLLRGVGYGNPPQASRFKKGQSGNPAGRPKKNRLSQPPSGTDQSPTEDIFMQLMAELISVRSGDQTNEITIFEAVQKAQVKTAINGSPTAQKAIIDRADRISKADMKRYWEELDFLMTLKLKQQAFLDKARAAGTSEREILPHPDDIIVEEGQPLRIAGPRNIKQLEIYERTLKLRELFLLYAIYSERFGDYGEAEEPAAQISLAWYVTYWIKMTLPERMRPSADAENLLTTRGLVTPKRRLEQMIKDRLAEFGEHVTRLKPGRSLLQALDGIDDRVDLSQVETP